MPPRASATIGDLACDVAVVEALECWLPSLLPAARASFLTSGQVQARVHLPRIKTNAFTFTTRARPPSRFHPSCPQNPKFLRPSLLLPSTIWFIVDGSRPPRRRLDTTQSPPPVDEFERASFRLSRPKLWKSVPTSPKAFGGPTSTSRPGGHKELSQADGSRDSYLRRGFLQPGKVRVTASQHDLAFLAGLFQLQSIRTLDSRSSDDFPD